MHPLTGLFLASMPFLLGGCGIPLGIAIASYAADGALLIATDKTSTDHLLSMSSGKDCAMWRVIKGREVCVERKPGEEDPYDVDRTAAHREVGEGGMVTVYAASRQGGHMLTDEEAKIALAGKPAMVAAQPPPEPGGVAPVRGPAVSGVADRRTVELADAKPVAAAGPPAAQARKRVQGRKMTAMSTGDKTATRRGPAAGRKPTPAAARRPAAKPPAAITVNTPRKPLPTRVTTGKPRPAGPQVATAPR